VKIKEGLFKKAGYHRPQINGYIYFFFSGRKRWYKPGAGTSHCLGQMDHIRCLLLLDLLG
jgi:hypothetical protein